MYFDTTHVNEAMCQRGSKHRNINLID